MKLPMSRKPDKLQQWKTKVRELPLPSKYQLELIIESGEASHAQARILATYALDITYK
jgi:hypothetical protein